ncbi:MAG: hypothetical protein Q4C98_00185, partial [Capnocytophaga sp.]|nr:hypothetical protein [Capnocytophaga sp.]
MKKIIRLLIILISMTTFQSVQGQYVNQEKISHYNNFVLSPHTNEGLMTHYQYWDNINGYLKLKEEYLAENHYYLSAVISSISNTMGIYSYKDVSFVGLSGLRKISFYSLNDKYLFIGELRRYSEFYIKIDFIENNTGGIDTCYTTLDGDFENERYFNSSYNREFRIKYINIPIHIPLKPEENNTYLPIEEKIKIYGRVFLASPIEIKDDIYNYQYRFSGEPETAWKDFKRGGVQGGTNSLGESRATIEISASDVFGSIEEATKH